MVSLKSKGLKVKWMLAEGISYVPKFFVLEKSKETTEKFTEGTTATVTLTNEVGHEIFKKSFLQKSEFQHFIEEYIVSFPGYSSSLALLIPPRTKNWEGLAKDILFPTLVNHALKQEGMIGKVSGSMTGIALDLLTLIPRLVMTPFKIFYDYHIQRLDHPLAGLLEDNLQAISSLKNGSLIAHMHMQEVEIQEKGSHHENWENFAATVKIVKVSQLMIANADLPCPLQEEGEVHLSSASYEGAKSKVDGHTSISSASKSSISSKPTVYHFFSGLEKKGALINAILSGELIR